jgi:hypothetical protein
MTRAIGLAILAGTALRLAAVGLSSREVADVARYRRMADHLLDVSWNPYQAPRLYPYPPLWAAWEAASGALTRRLGLPFPAVVKLPVAAAELVVVSLLGRRAGPGAAWIYALHPVGVLVSAFHGQFDALMMLFLLAAMTAVEMGRRDRGALALAAAISLKAFPVVLVPCFLLAPGMDRRSRARFALLATVPVALLLLPFALHDFPAVRRELGGYGGVADLGWIGLWRGAIYMLTGRLHGSEADRWGALVPAGKGLFLIVAAVLLADLARRTPRPPLAESALALVLAFQVCYGALSVQYLVWVLALAAAARGGLFWAWSGGATAALLGFYTLLAPGVLPLEPLAGPWRLVAASAWVGGGVAVWLTSAGWLLSLLRRRP